MATQIQAQISGALQKLGFKMQSEMLGAPEQHKVTQAVVDNLKELLNNNKSIWVNAQGQVEIK